jgi:hypothetical protein
MILFCSLVNGQVNMGTIEVNSTNTATLKFYSNIQNVVFGNNPQVGVVPDGSGEERPIYKYYGNFSSGKTDIIKLNDSTARQTSITIILDNEDVFYGSLKVGNAPKIYYDFTASQHKEAEAVQLKDSLTKRVGEAIITERLKFLMAKGQEYNDLGVEGNQLEFQVTNIMNDEKYTYIKFGIRNTSGSDYLIDNMIFKYVEGKKKGFKKTDAKIEERINPVLEPIE